MNARVLDRDGARKADLAAIHIGKAQLGWTDEEYRDILFTVCKVRSSAQLDFAGRKRFLEHMRACGFVNKARGARSGGEWKGPQKLVWSLWQQLADKGLVNDRSLAGLNAWLLHYVQLQHLTWLTKAPQQDQVIGMLKGWLKRGVKGA